MLHLLLFALLSSNAVVAQTAGVCDCDPSRPETMKQRQCSLCAEAERHPADQALFLLKDNNPRKPHRWLALPRKHTDGNHHISHLPAKERAALWVAAINKAKELWGDEWGVAYNGDKVRTQCHAHIHIGKLLKGLEQGKFIEVSRPDQIPVPKGGTGLWIHPHGKKLRVHIGEQICETVLLR